MEGVLTAQRKKSDLSFVGHTSIWTDSGVLVFPARGPIYQPSFAFSSSVESLLVVFHMLDSPAFVAHNLRRNKGIQVSNVPYALSVSTCMLEIPKLCLTRPDSTFVPRILSFSGIITRVIAQSSGKKETKEGPSIIQAIVLQCHTLLPALLPFPHFYIHTLSIHPPSVSLSLYLSISLAPSI